MNLPYKLLIAMTLLLFPLLMSGAEEKIVIEATANVQKSGYVGEAYEYTITLKSNLPNIADIRVSSNPEFPVDIDVLRGVLHNQRAREVKEKGKIYYEWIIQRNFLIPQKAGKYTIGEWQFVAFVPIERVVKDWFWGARRVVDYEEYPVKCQSVSIKADNLPANKTGKEFSGCIGDFKVEGWFPPGRITVSNDAIAVFKISGFGSLENLKVPNMSKLFVNGCKLKSVDQSESQSQRDGRLFSEVTLTCTFIPETAEFNIEPFSLLFFDPDSKKYVEVSSETLNWNGNDGDTHKSSGNKDAIAI